MTYLTPMHGQIRVLKRFAFFPVTIGHRIKWAEIYFVKQHYDSFEQRWVNYYFSNEKEYNLYNDGKIYFS